MNYLNNDKNSLELELSNLKKEYENFKSLNLSLNMARGKPSKAQLDLSKGMLDTLNSSSDLNAEDGTDCRNYGILSGINECKKLLSDIINVDPKNLIVFGNSSLKIMYDCIAHAFVSGVCGSTPWSKLDKVKWLCPVPGYDRHFAICEFLNIEMINIPMHEDGPDMDMIEELVSKDESVKGIWCVPKYSNPDGISYSDEVVKRFAKLTPKTKDFRIYWDNAYTVHHLYNGKEDSILNILDECNKAGNPDMVYIFTSTSKISFPGSGVAALATSDNNIRDILANLTVQTIGYDKINQLRHVRFFKDINGITAQMIKHAELLRPKFQLVEDILDNNVVNLGIAKYVKPHGGYFISLFVNKGCATRVYNLCKEAGLLLTPAGAAYPYHKDIDDSNLRIAPSFPPLNELKLATELLCLTIKIASIEQHLASIN